MIIPFFANARISITNIFPASCQNNGGLTVRFGRFQEEAGSGRASPFNIVVENITSGQIWTQVAPSFGDYPFANLYAGTYRIVVTNRFMCETIFEDILIEEISLELELSEVKVFPSCPNDNTGAIFLGNGISSNPHIFID